MITETKFPAHGITVTLYRQVERGTLYAYFSVGKARYRPNLKTTDLKAAKDAAREEVEKAHNEPKNRSTDRQTFADLAEAFWKDKWPECVDESYQGLCEDIPTYGTFTGVRGRLRLISQNFGHIVPAKLSLQDAIKLTQKILDRQKNGKTAVNHRETLRAFYRWLRREQLVTWQSNPCESELLELPPIEEPEPDPLNDEQVAKLIPVARNIPIWPVFLLCVGAGTRPAEARRVTWDNIDLTAKRVHVINRKGSKRRRRSPPLNSWLVEEFSKIPRTTDKVYPFTRWAASRQMEELSTLSGVKATLQQLRQTACTKAILSGMNLVDYVQNFGHALEVAERHYLRLGMSARVEGMEALKYE